MPDWMLAGSMWPEEGRDGTGRGGGATHFIRGTLRRIAEVFENDFFSEKYAAQPMLLQGIHPAVKLLVFLGYLVLAGFAARIPVLLAVALIPVLYAKLSGLNLRDYCRRAWGYLPALTLLLSLPGATGFFSRGEPLLTILPPGAPGLPHGLYFTAAGLAVAVKVALRCGISLSVAFLLLLTTRWTDILVAFRSLRVPAVFLNVLGMAYRYIFVVSDMAAEMMEARYLRTVGRLSAGENRRFVGRSAGLLFIRSHDLSGEIYDAMRCRGFSGRPVSLAGRKAGAVDALFAVGNVLIAILLIVGERLF